MNMSDVQRLDGWVTAARALRAHPGRWAFGWGPETFKSVYRLHRTQAAADLIGYERVADHVHNLPLELLVTLGAVGTAAFVYLGWDLWRGADIAARAALLGLGVMSMVEPVFFPPAAALFLLLGVRRKAHGRAPRIVVVLFSVVAAGVWMLDVTTHPLFLHPRESEANQTALMGALKRGRPELAVIYAQRAVASDPLNRDLVKQAEQLEAAVGRR